jgi:1-acyl-sn-glycerol-3-phosphate acyltransferase
VPGGVELREFSSGGHALLDGSLDLNAELQSLRMFRPPAPPRAIDIEAPSPEDLANASKQLDFLTKGLSPIFLSRDAETGRLTQGLGPVPVGSEGRPVLLVGNHQLYGADLGFIIREFLESKNGTLPRGLAHPAIFRGGLGGASDGDSGRDSGRGRNSGDEDPQREGGAAGQGGLLQLFERFGAVEVSPGAIFELLKRNETVLLFPGGTREAYHRKGEEYAVLWPEKTDFIRMAALFDALVVPFAAIGIADSVNMVLDSEEILKNPLLGPDARRLNRRVPSARAGDQENFVAPISVPRLQGPSRCYFLFQKPIDTAELSVYDKKACREAYLKAQSEVEDGIETLLRFRENDPYKDFVPRAFIETMSGRRAPTAPLNLKL